MNKQGSQLYDAKVSIIVPIYNSEKYLEKCIDSLLNQDYDNVEILLINDGSIDGSKIICEKYAKNNKKVRLYNNKNTGVSYSRNFGLKNCTGDFVTFIDSDDYVAYNYISTLIEYQVKDDYDIVISNAKDVIENIIIEKNVKGLPVVLNRDSTLNAFFSLKYFAPVCWGRLYKKNIISDIYFDESMSIAEDGKFFLEAIERSKKNIVIPEKNYFYFIRNGSLAHSGYDKKWLGELEFCNDCLKKYTNTKIENEVLYKFIEINVRLALMQNSETDGDINIFINNLKKYKKSFLKIKGHYKFKIKYLIALISPLRNTYKFIKFRKYSRSEE